MDASLLRSSPQLFVSDKPARIQNNNLINEINLDSKRSKPKDKEKESQETKTEKNSSLDAYMETRFEHESPQTAP
jgi:hypothetical protein